FFFFQAEDGIRDFHVTGVQTCALPISGADRLRPKLPTPRRRRCLPCRASPLLPAVVFVWCPFGALPPNSFCNPWQARTSAPTLTLIPRAGTPGGPLAAGRPGDRKSTRLNS